MSAMEWTKAVWNTQKQFWRFDKIRQIVNFATVNPSAEQILCKAAKAVEGQPFAACFLEYEENDAFNQLVLDAVYDPLQRHEGIAGYFNGKSTKQLHITTSSLTMQGKCVGIAVVFHDISELMELRDAVQAMQRIQALKRQLSLRNVLLNKTFGRYLSDAIVHELLETPDGLQLGEKKQNITVLMSDLRGFTAMSEAMEPQALITMLNHYFAEMTEIIQRNGGTVIEFMGDGILAMFGALITTERYAEKAIQAAVEMQNRMETVNAWNRQHDAPLLLMGIGIHTGECIVGNIGSEKCTKYSVIGMPLNLCARIESYSVGGQVLISPETKRAVGLPLMVADEQRIYPKGATEPLTIYLVTGIGDLFCTQNKETLLPLEKPIPVAFQTITEKHTSFVVQNGFFTAISHKKAILQTDDTLEQYANLQMDCGGKLFAKVLQAREYAYEIAFTAFPKDFDIWYEKTVGKP